MTQHFPLSELERADLVAFLDGELSPKAAQAWEARLNSDPAVRAEADSLRRAWEMLDFLPRAEPSPTFTTRTIDRLTVLQDLSPDQSWRRRGPAVIWAASLVFAVGAGFAAVRWQTPRIVPTPPALTDVPQQQLVENLRVADNLPLYEAIDDLVFLQDLDQLDLFVEES